MSNTVIASTQEDLIKLLIEHRELRTAGDGKLYIDLGRFMYKHEEVGTEQLDIDIWVGEVLTIPEKWYDNIPEEGVLCWVGDTKKSKEMAKVIAQYCPELEGRGAYRDEQLCTWYYATPVKKSECYE